MADTVKTTKSLVMVAEFADDDTRTLSLDDPNATIGAASAAAAAQILALAAYIKANQILIGDKTGAAFSRIKSAKIVQRSVTQLDLTEG